VHLKTVDDLEIGLKRVNRKVSIEEIKLKIKHMSSTQGENEWN